MPVQIGEIESMKNAIGNRIETRHGLFEIVRMRETGRGLELILLEVFE